MRTNVHIGKTENNFFWKSLKKGKMTFYISNEYYTYDDDDIKKNSTQLKFVKLNQKTIEPKERPTNKISKIFFL